MSFSGANKRWTIIYFAKDLTETFNRFYYETFRLSLSSFCYVFKTDRIVVYVPRNPESFVSNYLQLLITEYQIEVIDTIPPKLPLIMKLINEQKNIIILGTNWVFDFRFLPLNQLSYVDSITSILSSFKEINDNQVYKQLISKCHLDKIIDSEMLIIPYHPSNAIFINQAYQVASQIQSESDDFVTEISLTIINKNNNLIHSIRQQKVFDKITYYPLNAATRNLIREQRQSNLVIDWLRWLRDRDIPQPLIPFYQVEYLYYPCLDVDGELKKIDNFCSCIAFNTNRFSPTTFDEKCHIYRHLFKRFSSKLSGLFIRKETEQGSIPRTIHHLWLDEMTDSSDYLLNNPETVAWQRLLKNSWTYRLWTIKELRLEVFKPNANGLNRWEKLFNLESNVKVKTLIASFAILDKYGGILIEGPVQPLRLVPTEALQSRFIISFLDEESLGIQLSYRVMGSGARSTILDDVYHLFATNQLDTLDRFFMSLSNITIYPSYFFHGTFNHLPESLQRLAICIVLWKSPVLINNTTPNYLTDKDLKRSRKNVSDQILAKLASDPKNR